MALEVKIASPCTVKWESMTPVGDGERQRHCAQCKLNVFNIKELSESDVRAMLLKAEGRVCGRIMKRKDGTVLTKDCPRGVEALRKRAMLAMMGAAALFLTLIGVRIGSRKDECPSTSDSWFDRTVSARFYEVREELRDTKTFGPVVERFWPRVTVTAGAMVMMPPPTPTPVPVVEAP
ncbi:MAG: hypothetical protein QM817_34920 [Archangium sp.]